MLFQNLVSGPLRGLQGGKTFDKFPSNPVGDEYQSISLRNRKHGGLQGRQLRTDNAATQEQHVRDASFLSPGAHQNSLNISDTKPGHHAMFRIDRSKAQHHAARRAQTFVATLYQRNHRFIRIPFENGNRSLCGVGGFFSMPDSIHRRDQNSFSPATNHMAIAGLTLARENKVRDPVLHQRHVYCFHFFTVTIVPWPGSEAISNSSISRRTPGRPSPRLPEVEKPSRMA